MYNITNQQKSGSTVITPLFMALATAASMATAHTSLPNNQFEMNENIKIQPQSVAKLYDIDPYIATSKTTFYDKIVMSEQLYSNPITIIQNTIKQISTLNYIQVDDEIDKEIDEYFTHRQLKKSKRILLKRRS